MRFRQMAKIRKITKTAPYPVNFPRKNTLHRICILCVACVWRFASVCYHVLWIGSKWIKWKHCCAGGSTTREVPRL